MDHTTCGCPLLSIYTFAPLIGALVVLMLPSNRSGLVKTVAAGFAALSMFLGIYLLFVFKDSGALQYRESFPWISGINVYYRLGMDGLSAPMIVLSGIVGFIAVVASWGIEKQVKGYFALILLLLAGMNGVFCALDFFLFYVFWELMLLPMYFLIGIWGGPARVYAAIKFFLYTMAGSVLMLVVLLACWYWSDGSHSTPELRDQVKVSVLQRRAAAWGEVEKLSSATASQQELILDKYGISQTVGAKAFLKDSAELQKKLAALSPLQKAERAGLLEQVKLERTFSLSELRERYALFLGKFELFSFLPSFQFASLMFIFLFVAFAIKVPVFPFHTWLPWAHVEAPTAISVILAGILLKMGVYGFFRLSYGFFPTAAIAFAVPIAILGVLNIIYGACCAMAQDDMKKLVAYSSVSHMGFCMLGLAALTKWGMTGSVLQMFTHGTSTSMMFLLVGVIYDRAHHRDINKFGGLAQRMPLYAGFTTLALFASMGLPGLSGFVSEVLVFLGSFGSKLGQLSAPHWSFSAMTVVAALGVVLTAAYLLWMLQRVFFGPLNEKYKDYLDLSGREIFTLVPLVVLALVFGIYPQPLIDLTSTSVEKLQAHVASSQPKDQALIEERFAEKVAPAQTHDEAAGTSSQPALTVNETGAAKAAPQENAGEVTAAAVPAIAKDAVRTTGPVER